MSTTSLASPVTVNVIVTVSLASMSTMMLPPSPNWLKTISPFPARMKNRSEVRLDATACTFTWSAAVVRPSTTTNDFMGKDYLTGDLKKKIIAIKDLSYTGDFGLQELLSQYGLCLYCLDVVITDQ